MPGRTAPSAAARGLRSVRTHGVERFTAVEQCAQHPLQRRRRLPGRWPVGGSAIRRPSTRSGLLRTRPAPPNALMDRVHHSDRVPGNGQEPAHRFPVGAGGLQARVDLRSAVRPQPLPEYPEPRRRVLNDLAAPLAIRPGQGDIELGLRNIDPEDVNVPDLLTDSAPRRPSCGCRPGRVPGTVRCLAEDARAAQSLRYGLHGPRCAPRPALQGTILGSQCGDWGSAPSV
jgi:hypothetical protein